MKNTDLWQPSKFVRTDERLAASPDSEEVGIRSRIMANLIARAYEEVITKHASGALVDVGCGDVPLYETYRDKVSRVVCIDWENTQHPNPYVDVEADLNEGIPLPDEQFDTLLATDVLEHLRRPALFWKEVARVLKPSGKVIVGVPFLYWIHEDPYDYHRYTRYRLEAFCKENDLSIITLEAYGGPIAVLLDLIGKNVPGDLPAKTFQAVGWEFLRSSFGQYLDSLRQERFPLGYCLVAEK